jgi:hypothetical protein
LPEIFLSGEMPDTAMFAAPGEDVGAISCLPGLYALKGDAFLAEQRAQALVADVVDHPLGHQELRQLGQAPGRKRQAMLSRLRLGDLLDLAAGLA